jgi:hypothetical protein
MTSDEDFAAADILAIFAQRNSDGTPRFPHSDIRAFIPAAVLAADLNVKGLPALEDLMNEFALKIGCYDGMSRQSLQQALDTHFRRHPLNPELVRTVEAYCREKILAAQDPASVRPFQNLLHMTRALTGASRGLAAPAPMGVGLRRRN